MKLYVGVTDNIMNTMVVNCLGTYQGTLLGCKETVFLEINGVTTTPMFTAFSR